MGEFQEFTFGEGDEKVGKKQKAFKGKEDERYRFSFAWFNGYESDDFGIQNLQQKPKFVGAKRLYHPQVGYFLYKGPEYEKLSQSGVKYGIGTIVIVWPTLKNGNIDKSRFMQGDFAVMPWVLSEDKYTNLSQIHDEFAFGTHDIKVHCTDAQYQKMTFSPCQESLFAKMLENENAAERVKEILEMVRETVSEVEPAIARDYTLDQIREKLGGETATAAPTAAASAEELDEMLKVM